MCRKEEAQKKNRYLYGVYRSGTSTYIKRGGSAMAKLRGARQGQRWAIVPNTSLSELVRRKVQTKLVAKILSI
jgi:hypothetical protein